MRGYTLLLIIGEKDLWARLLLALTAFLLYPTATEAQRRLDTLLLQRTYDYPHYYAQHIDSFQTNVYTKHVFQTPRRNFTLWCVPSMYAIAHGRRSFVSEQYSRFTFGEDGVVDNKRQVYYTTIPHNRRPMPTLLEFTTPSIYDETIYGDHILSPFHRVNRHYYRYSSSALNSRQTRLYFRPRFSRNTQLVRGQATVDNATGRILEVEMDGEFDMMRFQTLTMQGDYGSRALLPKFCRTSVDFKFLGNHISSSFESAYDCPITLPDSVSVRGNRQLIDSVRPYLLTYEEETIYENSRRKARRDSLPADVPQTTAPSRKRNYLLDISWDKIGESLISSLRTSSDAGYVRLSPIINPQYISYSRRKGLSYRFKLGAQLNIGEDVSLGLNTRFGYNFKQRKFYFSLPLRLNYVYRNRDAYTEMQWASGNRTYNSTVLDELKRKLGPHPELDEMDLDQFDDWNMRLVSHLPLNNRLGVEAGMVLHHREAVNSHGMYIMGMPKKYRSLAPSLSLMTRPWRKGPLFTFDYERGLPVSDYLGYERWEADASIKHRIHRLQTLNMRVGMGLYTNREKNYFMDYTNFRDENLPGGWDDDWSGNFQLLSSRLYNMSDYYVRGHASFESPLLAASFLPIVGHYVESERVYISSLSIAHTRLYSELGYGFKCRLFSVGAFASFLNTRFQEAGAKFTFELFRRW